MASRLFREKSLIRGIIAYHVGHLTTRAQEGSPGAISELKRRNTILCIKGIWKLTTLGRFLRQYAISKGLNKSCISRMGTFGRYPHFNPHFIIQNCLRELGSNAAPEPSRIAHTNKVMMNYRLLGRGLGRALYLPFFFLHRLTINPTSSAYY